MNTPGGNQMVSIVNEAGLYSLLFAMQLKKARGVSDEYIEERCSQLKAFKRWVTHEVIPSIRKHGTGIKIDTLSRKELSDAVQVAVAMCIDNNVQIDMILSHMPENN